jgi:hypothetical protein
MTAICRDCSHIVSFIVAKRLGFAEVFARATSSLKGRKINKAKGNLQAKIFMSNWRLQTTARGCMRVRVRLYSVGGRH